MIPFYSTKSLQQTQEEARCVSNKTRGQVAGNDTAEQSFHFSKRLGPLNLQVPVSFCRQCLNIVAVLIQKPGPSLLLPWSCSRRETSGGERQFNPSAICDCFQNCNMQLISRLMNEEFKGYIICTTLACVCPRVVRASFWITVNGRWFCWAMFTNMSKIWIYFISFRWQSVKKKKERKKGASFSEPSKRTDYVRYVVSVTPEEAAALLVAW